MPNCLSSWKNDCKDAAPYKYRVAGMTVCYAFVFSSIGILISAIMNRFDAYCAKQKFLFNHANDYHCEPQFSENCSFEEDNLLRLEDCHGNTTAYNLVLSLAQKCYDNFPNDNLRLMFLTMAFFIVGTAIMNRTALKFYAKKARNSENHPLIEHSIFPINSTMVPSSISHSAVSLTEIPPNQSRGSRV